MIIRGSPCHDTPARGAMPASVCRQVIATPMPAKGRRHGTRPVPLSVVRPWRSASRLLATPLGQVRFDRPVNGPEYGNSTHALSLLSPTRPRGAAECSHGCSAARPQRAKRNPWKASSSNKSAPQGRRNATAQHTRRRAVDPGSSPEKTIPLPLRGKRILRDPFHGFRDAPNGVAPPVATFPRPVGAPGIHYIDSTEHTCPSFIVVRPWRSAFRGSPRQPIPRSCRLRFQTGRSCGLNFFRLGSLAGTVRFYGSLLLLVFGKLNKYGQLSGLVR